MASSIHEMVAVRRVSGMDNTFEGVHKFRKMGEYAPKPYVLALYCIHTHS